MVGDLVYIYGDRNKSRARDSYLVVFVHGVCVASIRLSDHSYATLLILQTDPSATPFTVTVKTLLPIHIERSTQTLQVDVTIPSNKIAMFTT